MCLITKVHFIKKGRCAMSKNIVSQATAQRVLGRVAEVIRMLLEGGLEFDDLQIPISDPERRRRLVAYWKAGMPEVDLWKIWKTIKRNSVLRRSGDFLCALVQHKFEISDWTKDIMSKDDFNNSLRDDLGQKYDLFLLTTERLTGKADCGTTQEVFAGAKRLDYQKCPAWIGPQLRLDYEDQSNSEWIQIGMEPILSSNGCLRTFGVGRGDSELLLGANPTEPGTIWAPSRLWIFCRPRK